MPKGPLGAPRPFSEYRLIIDPHETEIYLVKVGPFGGPRPLAKDNPPVEDERVAECMLSASGRKFGAGVTSNGATTNMNDLSPEEQQQALEVTEKWCRGVLEASAIEDLEEGDEIDALSRIRQTLAGQTGRADNITIEVVDQPSTGLGELG